MIIVPRENPVFENLNSRYLRMDQFVSHLSEEFVNGCIYFKSFAVEGVLYFGEDSFFSGLFNTKNSVISGQPAIDYIGKDVLEGDFSVSVYRIVPERLYYWASLGNAEEIHRDVSSEIMALSELIVKMRSGKLTGIIEINTEATDGVGIIYLINGEIVGSSATWENSGLHRTKEHLGMLAEKVKSHGGRFTVRQISMSRGSVTAQPKIKEKPVVAPTPEKESPGTERAVHMLQKLLVITENTFRNHTGIKQGFEMILKKKFVEKVSKFEFLDPFAAEFVYVGEKVTFSGTTKGEDLICGVVACVKEMAAEYSVDEVLRKNLSLWTDNYAQDLRAAGTEI